MKFLLSFRRYLRHPIRLIAVAISLLIAFLVLFGSKLASGLTYPEILIAPIMSLGSFVAGATFLGGGAIAFPALTKILGADPQTAKTFSFAIQSIGMTAASVYILTRISVLPILLLIIYIVSAIAGLIFSLLYFQELFLPNDIRIIFTIFVLCFYGVYLWVQKSTYDTQTNRLGLSIFEHVNIRWNFQSLTLTILCALLGGAITGLIGSGADLFAFCLLTLFFRLDIKLSTQLSIIIMATLSVVGVCLEVFLYGQLPEEVIKLWLIAAPIVLFGAPLGAIFCRRVNSKFLKIFIGCIVAVEVISTFILVDIQYERQAIYLLSLVFGLLFLVAVSFLSPHRKLS